MTSGVREKDDPARLTMLVLLVVVYGFNAIFGLFIPDKNIPPCFGHQCMNGGVVDWETCSCKCNYNYEGHSCETEIKHSSWPRGSYSLLSTVFGCPEPEDHGWRTGYLNMTVSPETNTRQWFLERFRLLGPYHLHTIQFNFCTRRENGSNTALSNSWPSGIYCIFKAKETDCQQGFHESSLPLKDYSVWKDDIGGAVPDVIISDGGVILTLCCRDDGRKEEAAVLPAAFPFYLLKPFPGQYCQDVSDMVITEEQFSFVKTTNRTWLESDGIFTVDESDLYFNLTLCYYEPYERRECIYKEDYGASYRGRENVSSDGRVCQRWTELDFTSIQHTKTVDYFDLTYESDYEENYCRQLWGRMWNRVDRPFCGIGNKTAFCNISYCDPGDDLPNIMRRKFYRSAPALPDTPIRHIADGSAEKPPFSAAGSYVEPWVQVDLQEDYEIHSVTMRKVYDALPNLIRRVVTYVSKYQWDFLTFGAYTCNGPYNPPRTKAFRFQCLRPLIGSFVTLQNFVHYDPSFNTNQELRFEVSELIIRGKATGCGKSLGIKSGDVKDFQFTSSMEGKGSSDAHHSRLNRKTGWCDRTGATSGFIQVDLLTPMVVQGVIIQGWNDGRASRIPDNFTIRYGVHEGNLTHYMNSYGDTKVFRVDQTLVSSASQKFIVPNEVITRILRIELYQQSTPVCLKFDVIGCPKRVEFDLKCQKNSTRFGLQTLQGHLFSGYRDFKNFYGKNTTLELCRSRYLSNTLLYASYIYNQSDSSCVYLPIHRYNRQKQHLWDTGYGQETQYGQLMCVKDIMQTQVCGGLVKKEGEIYSPSYPFYYGENINCDWFVTLKPGTFASLLIMDINLAAKEEPNDDSVYFDCEDALTIYDKNEGSSHIVSMLTGSPFDILEGSRYISSTNKMEINLVSCHRVRESAARGFKIMVNAIECGGCGQGKHSCSRRTICTDQCGYITSIDHPNFYPVSTSCHWRIQGHMGQYVNVTFDMIDVIAEEECEGDFVSLYDLELSGKQSLIEKFCKINRPIENVISSWHMMDVEFYSDFQTTGRGFLLKYTLETVQLTSTSTTSALCDVTSFEYDQGCYSFHTNSHGLSWFAAEENCRKRGGHLVSVSHPDEMLFLHATILNNNLFTEQKSFIGLRKTGTHTFGWTDGKPLTYTDWYAGDATTPRQPDGLDEEACTIMEMSSIHSTGTWHDVACAFNKVKQYICETSVEVSTSNETAQSQMTREYSATSKDGYYFLCNSGEHISGVFVCDAFQDCLDGSDEGHCTEASCPRGKFTCSDGSCVDMAFYCDHRQHCQDGSDENNCVYRECNGEQWRCASGQCVSSRQRCNLLVDCTDGSDEKNCERCNEPFFQCYDGRCLPPARVCDGFVDCGGQYREDEGSQCTTNSQPSCSAWHALGVTQNGKYNINIIGQSVSYPVECVFDMTKGMATTIIHHNMEDTEVTGNWLFDKEFQYSVPKTIISYVKSTSSNCRQHIQIDCLHAWNIYLYNIRWYDVSGTKRNFYIPDPIGNCSCILEDTCNATNSRCACDKTMKDVLPMDDDEYLTDSGDINDMDSLPVTKLLTQLRKLRRVRHNIGPLICEEPVQPTSMSILCKSGVVIDAIHKCILDYDTYEYYTGCRDVSHLQYCENVVCPADYIKCPSSYCIPIRLVCDGHPDCVDGMDERGCSNMTCPGRFRCHSSKTCIPWQQVCDKTRHCPEGDDEYFCNTSCPSACTCDGSYVICTNFNLDHTELLPPYTRVLDISQSLSNTVVNNSFGHMEKLAVLDLSHLGVYELEADSLIGLHNVLQLNLSMNYLEEIPKGLFRSMNKLQNLLLKGNKISKIYPGSFEGLSMLPLFDLCNMALKELTEGAFHGLGNLLFLNLSNNELTAVDNGAFHGLVYLQSLDLRENNIKEFTEEIFTDLNKLTHLYNDRYVFCCFRPSSVPQGQCLPQSDEFSSCSDLMRNEALRISMWFLGFMALAGNIFTVIYRCIYDKECLRRSNDLFVANLAISDIFMGIYMIIIASADEYYRGVYSLNDEHWRTSWICQLAGFLSALSSETSVMFLCMITLERVLVIRYPFRDFRAFIQKSSGYSCVGAWLLGTSIAGIPLLPISYFSGSFYSRSGVCLALPLTRNRPPGWEYSTAIFVIWNFICFVFIAIGQATIYHTVKTSQKIRKGRTSNDMVIARKLSFIVLTDFACWFPICVMGLLALNGHAIGSEVYAWVSVFVLPINSALNPIIYTLSSINTMRHRQRKTEKSFVTASRSTVRSKVTNSPRMYLCLREPKTCVSLTTYLRTGVTASNILAIAQKTAVFLDVLHTNCLISGEVHTDNIYVSFHDGAVKKIVVSCVPTAAQNDVEVSKDILDFGQCVVQMLKSFTASKTRNVQLQGTAGTRM